MIDTQQINNLKANKDSYIFNLSDFENISNKIKVSDLVICSGHNRSVSFCSDNDFPIEVIHQNPTVEFYGYKESFLQLGVNIIGMILKNDKYLELTLSHPKSKIKKLYFRHEIIPPINNYSLQFDFQTKMKSFEFYPRELCKHPFTSHSPRGIGDADRPGFYYAWENYNENFQQTTSPDYIVVDASIDGMLALSEMFIDFGREENNIDEINLETTLYGGMEGARPGGLEAQFWLPGSFGFPEKELDNIITR
jgi:hypothetical protein